MYYSKNIGYIAEDYLRLKMCMKDRESVSHIFADCSALAQTKYVWRHNSALKIWFFGMLKEFGLVDSPRSSTSPYTRTRIIKHIGMSLRTRKILK